MEPKLCPSLDLQEKWVQIVKQKKSTLLSQSDVYVHSNYFFLFPNLEDYNNVHTKY